MRSSASGVSTCNKRLGSFPPESVRQALQPGLRAGLCSARGSKSTRSVAVTSQRRAAPRRPRVLAPEPPGLLRSDAGKPRGSAPTGRHRGPPAAHSPPRPSPRRRREESREGGQKLSAVPSEDATGGAERAMSTGRARAQANAPSVGTRRREARTTAERPGLGGTSRIGNLRRPATDGAADLPIS